MKIIPLFNRVLVEKLASPPTDPGGDVLLGGRSPGAADAERDSARDAMPVWRARVLEVGPGRSDLTEGERALGVPLKPGDIVAVDARANAYEIAPNKKIVWGHDILCLIEGA